MAYYNISDIEKEKLSQLWEKFASTLPDEVVTNKLCKRIISSY